MTQDQTDPERTVGERVAEEERVQEKVDEKGKRWRKVYFGGGAHFRNWLNQCLELCGGDSVEVEEIDYRGFECYEESGERMYRIWVKDGSMEQKEGLLPGEIKGNGY